MSRYALENAVAEYPDERDWSPLRAAPVMGIERATRLLRRLADDPATQPHWRIVDTKTGRWLFRISRGGTVS